MKGVGDGVWLVYWVGAGVEFGRGCGKIFEEGGAEPAFELELFAPIPVAAGFGAPPLELNGVAGKWRGGEGEAKAFVGVGNVLDEAIDHLIDAGDERFAEETDGGVVEDPGALVSVWGDDSECVHG
jgi:hypothetical protein